MSNNVKIIEKNTGEKIAWKQDGTRLYFGDDEIMINAAKYQKNEPVEVDICKDHSGNLTIGTESALRYVAQIIIPAATYTDTPTAAAISWDESEGTATTTKTKDDLDMANVTLILWSIE